MAEEVTKAAATFEPQDEQAAFRWWVDWQHCEGAELALKCAFYRHRQAALTTARAEAEGLREEVERLRDIAGEAAFLLARLSDLDWAQSFESFARDYDGHVDPSESRLRNLIAEYRSALTEPRHD